jgi:transposase
MKPKERRRKFTKEFKIEAVKLVREQGMTYRKVGEDLGVSGTVVARWARQLEESGEYAFPGKGKRDARDEALRQLEEENRQLRMERDILKKAMAYFAKNPE